MASDDAQVLRDQIDFYRAQAAHYLQDPYPDDDRVLAACPPSSHCLELASGTGRWTRQLLGVCDRITAVDASPEMHERNRALNGDARVEYVVADLFAFRPSTRCDLIFAGSWLSHIPSDRLAPFWAMLDGALLPDGRVVMVDDGVVGSDDVSRFADGDPSGEGPERRSADGRDFTIVKIAYAPDALESLLEGLGWSATVTLLSPVTYLLEAHR